MKKLISLLIIAVSVISLSSCARNTKKDFDPSEQDLAQQDGQQNENAPTDNESSEYESVNLPSDDDLSAMIDAYLEYESYCTYNNPPFDFDNPISDDPDSDEHWIYPVTKEGMTTWQDWLNYLGSIFTDEGIEAALERTDGRYINYNDNLYYRDGGMAWTVAGEYSIAKFEKTENDGFAVQFWREVDAGFYNDGVREFFITDLDFKYTENGWRIAHDAWRESTPDDDNPNLE